MPPSFPMDILSQSAAAQLAALASGAVSAADLMAATLARLAALNPGLNAIVAVRPAEELMAEAEAVDRARAGGAALGPLAGLPFAVKDLVATKGLTTTWGSPLYAGHVPKGDDLLAARLRAAGALFIGKTNVAEWGQGSHSFNPVYGATHNPYDPSRSAGGSSGGAAAALAARLVALADGSDMMGSLRNPAAFCNVYGFRPSFGLVPTDPRGELFLGTLATEGPMARSPGDLALLLDVLKGPTPGAPFARAATPPFAPLSPRPLTGLKIGWLADWGGAFPMEPGILPLCAAALRVLEKGGARVHSLPPPFPSPPLWQAWCDLRAALTAGALQSAYESPAQRAQIKPETLGEIERGRGLSALALYRASDMRSRWYRRVLALFDRYDLLALPSAQVWPFPAEWRWPESIAGQKMDSYHRWMEVTVPAAMAGLPVLALPIGFGPEGSPGAGLPMGLQLIGPPGSDAALLAYGATYHEMTDWPGQHPPRLAAAGGAG